MSFNIKNTVISGLAGVLLSLGMLGEARAANNDFDGDGLADLISVETNVAANTTTFNIRRSANGQIMQNVVPMRGDAFYTHLSANGTYAVGVVRVLSLTQPLLWMKRDFLGNIAQSFFGLPGDIIPRQVDFDLDGTTDRVVGRNHPNGSIVWYGEKSSTGQIVEVFFGETGDLLFTDHYGRYGVVRNRPSTGEVFKWFLLSPLTNTLAQIQQWGLNGDVPEIPLFINQLAVVRTEGTRQRLYIRQANSAQVTHLTCLAGETPNLGSFFNPPNNHMACHNRSIGGVRVYNVVNNGYVDVPFANANQYIIGGNGQVFPPTGGENPPPSGSGDCGGLPVQSIRSFSNILWKGINEHGSRGGTMLFQFSSTNPGKNRLRLKDINCQDLKIGNNSLGVCRYANDRPFGCGGRFYAGTCGGPNYSGTQISNQARAQSGSGSFLVEGRNNWYRVDNPGRDGTINKTSSCF